MPGRLEPNSHRTRRGGSGWFGMARSYQLWLLNKNLSGEFPARFPYILENQSTDNVIPLQFFNIFFQSIQLRRYRKQQVFV